MLRSFLIYLSKAAWAQRMVTQWKFAWRAASRFVAGETLEEALCAVQTLNAKGITATLDQLGEHTSNLDEARHAAQDITHIVDAIAKSGLKSNVSIKLSQLGMTLDKSICAENMAVILSRAREHNIFIRLDMEDSNWVDTTFELYSSMRVQGFENVGLVIQSYLFRSQKDVQSLCPKATRIRLCKGAYKEPPHVAFPKKSDVDANFDVLAKLLVDCSMANGAPLASEDGKWPPIPVIASHDPKRIEYAIKYAQSVGLPQKAIEFQMLYGIRRDLQEGLAAEGYPVRIYVPYGTHWYPYYVRRLAERPANVWFFISNFLRR